MLLIDLIQDFVIELIRAVVVDGLCQRIQRRINRRTARRKRRRLSERALHRLVTDRRENR